MISDPLFYVSASLAVFLVGLAKGGLGGAVALLAVPLMSLTIDPVRAAAIMLPILIAMDGVSLFAWRGIFDKRALSILVPVSILGIGFGWATAAYVNQDQIRLLIGVIAITFCLRYAFGKGGDGEGLPHNWLKGSILGTFSGFTSFVSHAGGPPYQMYMLPLRLAPPIFAGTSVIYFSVMNMIKVVPYFALGQLSPGNLWTSAALLPVAIIATLTGVRVVKLISLRRFYAVSYSLMFLVSLKLVWDGVQALIS